MALTNTVLFTVDAADTSMIHVRSKDLQTILYSFDNVQVISSMVFDHDRKKLWVCGTTGSVKRFDISDTAETLEDTIASVGICYNQDSMAIDTATGNLFCVPNVTGVTKTVKKILLTSAGTVDGSLAMTTFTTTTTSQASVMIIDGVGYLFVYNAHAGSQGNYQYEPLKKFTLDLVTVTDGYDMINVITSGASQYALNATYGHYTISTSIFTKGCVYNPVSNKITVGYNMANQVNIMYDKVITLNFSDPNDYNVFPFSKYTDSGLNSASVEDMSAIFVGRNSGNVYFLSDARLTKWKPNGEEVFSKVIPSGQVATIGSFAFNEVTEDIYLTRYTDKKVIRLNKSGNIIEESIVMSNYPTIILVGLGSTEVNATSNQTEASYITYPASGVSITDTTPTIIFRIGTNPAGWTQQFRFIADTTMTTASSGDPLGTYDRTFDSWLNGSAYTDCTWEYSTDHDETNTGNPLNGTWTALGTGDGLQSGGTTPTNGVNSQMDVGSGVYVKLTIPALSELTGAATNTPWYFNVFSYSKFV